jgi:16S rRNA (uracil1498-N3)-methyltransferase
VVALDGSAYEYIVRLTFLGKRAIGSVEERRMNDAEPGTRLALYQALLKGQKLDLVLQKGTEIGVSRFVPVRTTRSIPSEISTSRMRRLQEIVREAAEQSGRGIVPQVGHPIQFRDAISHATSTGPVIFLQQEETAHRLSSVVASKSTQCLSLFVGPEGGYDAEEASLARGAGCLTCTLGPRTLRAETAGIVGAALILSLLGDLA